MTTPESLRPIWVANVDHATRQSVCDAQGVPLIAWSPQAITPENIDQLVADRRLLRPNTHEPFTDADDLVVSDAGSERVSIRHLAMRRPPPEGLKQGEVILHERAQDELLPHFITGRLAQGVAGWLVGGSAGRIHVLRRRGHPFDRHAPRRRFSSAARDRAHASSHGDCTSRHDQLGEADELRWGGLWC